MKELNRQAGPVIIQAADLVKKPRCEDISGRKFGRLTAIRIHHKHGTQYKWLCSCECGGEQIIFAHSLKCGDTRSCGCLSQVEDVTGRVFKRWTVLRKDESRPDAHWICMCDCGKEGSVCHYNLVSGISGSCGCLERELASKRHTIHGHSRRDGKCSSTYRAWAAMWTRCTNAKQIQWEDYGGRGIKICPQWKDFTVFFADMGERPYRMTLGRKDNDGNYEPWNCHWESRKSQNNNKRNNRRLEMNGRVMNIGEWETETGIHHMIIHHRIRKGWSIERALTEPVIHKPKRKPITPSQQSVGERIQT